MKKLMLTVCLVLGLLVMAAPMAMAATIYIEDNYGPYNSGSGGEFTFRPDATLAYVLTFYSSNTKNQGYSGTFQTFCVETDEYISDKTTYFVSLSNKAVRGGSNTNDGDNLSQGAAWLYHEFQNGTLKDYNYGSQNQRYSSRLLAADALQKAIWALEDENLGATSSFYYGLAVAHFGGETAAKADNVGNANISVMVLNLYHNTSGGYVYDQDSLVCVPEPGILILLGIAMSAIGAASWRLRKL